MDYDYIIIGGGSAGAVLARRLSDANIGSVVLIEAGKSDETDSSLLDLSLLDTQSSETEWNFRATPTRNNSKQIKYLRAKMLGGCGNHNDCAFLMPPDCDFDHWSTLGATGWSAPDVAPFFKMIDSMVHIDMSPPISSISRSFLQAGMELGLDEVDFRKHIMPGVGSFPLNAWRNKRHSSSVCYLHPLDKCPPNLEILCNTRVDQLLIDGNCIVGCSTSRGEISANKEIILCCGAVQTPQLMMLSGIGPAAHISEFDLEVKIDLPGVGRNLLDHAAANLVVQLKDSIPPWELTPCEVSMLLQVEKRQPAPDLLYHFVLRYRDKYGDGDKPPENVIKISPNVTRPRSRGELRLQSSDINEQPYIDLNYFSDLEDYDMRIMLDGIRFTREIVKTEAFKELGATELLPGPHIQSDFDLAEYIRETCETVYHPAGTCRMGHIDDPSSVVDPALKVKGVSKLRVCDASVFPSMVTVNINNTVMMIAEKAATIIIEEAHL